MYWNHFGLNAEPFSLTPDPAFLYLSEGHSEALAALKLGLLERRGVLAMIGEVGTGKTTLLYSLLAGLDAEIKTAYVSNTRLNFDGILRGALRDFGVKPQGTERLDMLESLNEFLLECAENDTTAALIIDEAQNLSPEAFEEIRLLSNFETYTTKLLQIVLVGQPELATKLADRSLRQINERIAVRSYLNPLDDAQARRYVQHRLEAAGASREIFEPRAMRRVMNYSRGVPRRINILCHNTLLHAYGREAATVTSEIVEEVIRDQQGVGLRRLDAAPAPQDDAIVSAEAAPTPVSRWASVTAWTTAGLALGSLVTWLALPSLREWTPDTPVGVVEAIASAPQTAVVAELAPVARASDRALGAPRHQRKARQPREATTLSPRTQARLAHVIAALEAADAAAPVAEPAPAQAAASEPAPTSETTPAPAQAATVPSEPAAAVAPAPAVPKPVAKTVSVPRGTTLSRLMLNIYGDYNGELLHTVRKANPTIVDPDYILAGQKIRFPLDATSPAVQSQDHE